MGKFLALGQSQFSRLLVIEWYRYGRYELRLSGLRSCGDMSQKRCIHERGERTHRLVLRESRSVSCILKARLDASRKNALPLIDRSV
jgi:hypothetical protein